LVGVFWKDAARAFPSAAQAGGFLLQRWLQSPSSSFWCISAA
jgi:hypothetical protein